MTPTKYYSHLVLCTEGALPQFAKLALLQTSRSGRGWGTFNNFMTKLEQTFGDPNEERNEFVQLEKLKMRTMKALMNIFRDSNWSPIELMLSQ